MLSDKLKGIRSVLSVELNKFSSFYLLVSLLSLGILPSVLSSPRIVRLPPGFLACLSPGIMYSLWNL